MYGDELLSDLFMGSGGGGGAGGVSGPGRGLPGGNGGGLVVVHTDRMIVAGTVVSNGQLGSTNYNCGSHGSGGGGGGAGGTIWLTALTMELGGGGLAATGATGRCNGGGTGGVGRIRLDFGTINGFDHGTDEASTATNAMTEPDPGFIGAL